MIIPINLESLLLYLLIVCWLTSSLIWLLEFVATGWGWGAADPRQTDPRQTNRPRNPRSRCPADRPTIQSPPSFVRRRWVVKPAIYQFVRAVTLAPGLRSSSHCPQRRTHMPALFVGK